MVACDPREMLPWSRFLHPTPIVSQPLSDPVAATGRLLGNIVSLDAFSEISPMMVQGATRS